jgi:viologen exporter family transport system permease protein
MSLSNTAKFARALLATNLKASLMLRGAFVMQAAFMVLNNVTYFLFWWLLMRRVPEVRGWHLADIQLLFGIVAAAFGLTVTVAGGVRHLGRFINEGELDTLLAQPKPVLLHALGMRSQPSGAGDMLSGFVFIVLSGQVSWHDAPLVVIAVLAATVTFVACGVIFSGLAFWMGDVETLARQLWELTITFALYPEPLFGGVLRLLLFTALPAGIVGYLPARVIRTSSWTLAGALTLAAASYLVAAIVMFDRGLKRYTSGSRFATLG